MSSVAPAVLEQEVVIEHDKKQLHPLQHPSVHSNPLVVERGQGVWLYTADGRKVLDGMAGLWERRTAAGGLRADEEGGLHLQLCRHDNAAGG